MREGKPIEEAREEYRDKEEKLRRRIEGDWCKGTYLWYGKGGGEEFKCSMGSRMESFTQPCTKAEWAICPRKKDIRGMGE